MSKTDYIIIPEAKISMTQAKNPEEALKFYRDNHPGIKNIVIVPHLAVRLNGKRVPLAK